MDNIFTSMPDNPTAEVFDLLLQHDNVRIERILSKGHTSPGEGWYDQAENEWVIVLQGAGTLLFEDGRKVNLGTGDFFNIPARAKHKVAWTDPEETTVWLAVFYK